MSRSRWLTWTPEASIMQKTPDPELTKPTKPDSVSFVSPRIDAFPIIETTKPTANQAIKGDSFRYKIAPVPPRPAAQAVVQILRQSASRLHSRIGHCLGTERRRAHSWRKDPIVRCCS